MFDQISRNSKSSNGINADYWHPFRRPPQQSLYRTRGVAQILNLLLQHSSYPMFIQQRLLFPENFHPKTPIPLSIWIPIPSLSPSSPMLWPDSPPYQANPLPPPVTSSSPRHGLPPIPLPVKPPLFPNYPT